MTAVDSSSALLLPSTLGIIAIAFLVIWRLSQERSALFWGVAFILWTACEILILPGKHSEGQAQITFGYVLFLLSIFFQMHGLQDYAGEGQLALRFRIIICAMAIGLVIGFSSIPDRTWIAFSARLAMRLILTGIALAALRRNFTHAVDKLLFFTLLAVTVIVTAFAVAVINSRIAGVQYPMLGYSRIVSNSISIIFALTAMSAILYNIVQRYRDEALIDKLSGLSNRRHFDTLCDTEWQRAAHQNLLLSMLMIDVDYFKQYNDNYGHAAGDTCLASVAKIIRMNIRQNNDYCARIGGEEFAVLLPRTTGSDAATAAQNICNAIRRSAIPHEKSPFGIVTVSIGVATAMPAGNDDGTLFQTADAELYKAKILGRNRVN